MLDTFNSSNHRDFGPRYANTFGWLVDEKSGTKKLIQITEVQTDRVFFKTNTSQVYHANLDSSVVFEFIQVKQGWFNSTDGESYLLSRSPARQWKRGISNSNTTVQRLRDSCGLDVSYKLLDQLKWEEDGYNQAEGAISKHFAICPAGSFYFYSQIIGKVKEKTITLYTRLVHQELTDLIRRKNLSFEVVVNE